MSKQLILYLFIFSMMSCSSQETFSQNEGIVTEHLYMFRPGDTIEVKLRVLYRNNQTIQEVPQLNIVEDSSGKRTFTKILHYSYLDPGKNVCYNYRNFSDTAKVIKRYSNIDSVRIKGGWNFYSNKDFQYNSSTSLQDTVINGINYSRIRLDKDINGIGIYFHLYLRCDKKGTLIKYFKPISDKIGCPIVRIDTYEQNNLTISHEIEFVSDKLSQEEVKVLETWERNAEKQLK